MTTIRTDITYQRPIPAKMVVRLATGEEWEATTDDIARFAKPVLEAAYFRFHDYLQGVLLAHDIDLGMKADIVNSPLNLVIGLAQTIFYFGFEPSEHQTKAEGAYLAALDELCRAGIAAAGAGCDPHGIFEQVEVAASEQHITAARRLLAVWDEDK